MGRAKDGDMERQNQIQLAIGLCEEVGAIEECAIHEGTYIDTMEWSDPEELVVAIVERNPEAQEYFTDREEMVERVRDALQHAGEECPSCARNRDS